MSTDAQIIEEMFLGLYPTSGISDTAMRVAKMASEIRKARAPQRSTPERVGYPVSSFERNKHDSGMLVMEGQELWNLPPGKYWVFTDGSQPISTPIVEPTEPVGEVAEEALHFVEVSLSCAKTMVEIDEGLHQKNEVFGKHGEELNLLVEPRAKINRDGLARWKYLHSIIISTREPTELQEEDWELACAEIGMGGIFDEFRSAPDAIRQLGHYIHDAEKVLDGDGLEEGESLAGRIIALKTDLSPPPVQRNVDDILGEEGEEG